jgi:hypothetical protein
LTEQTGNHADDWRLMGQERYLQGATLELRDYEARSDSWEHDHCEFCQRTFLPAAIGDPGARTRGYTTTAEHARGAGYYWVCEDCFADFATRFGWRRGT